MNPDIKKLWVDALRSGEYTQTTKRLKTEEGFCCLGVLCNIFQQSHTDVQWKQEASNISFLSKEADLPDEVSEWAEFGHDDRIHLSPPITNPYITYKGQKISLTCANDSIKLSFKEIADIIEEQL